MKPRASILLLMLFIGCGKTPPGNLATVDETNEPDTASMLPTASSNDSELDEDSAVDEEYATYVIVIADTGTDYYSLHSKMFALNRQLHTEIDTMGRFYNETKDLIALPDDDPDEIYAGDYFPRRYPSNTLSLEYLSSYKDVSNQNTIALVAGICETEETADSILTVLRTTENKAFRLKARLYIGCMH